MSCIKHAHSVNIMMTRARKVCGGGGGVSLSRHFNRTKMMGRQESEGWGERRGSAPSSRSGSVGVARAPCMAC